MFFLDLDDDSVENCVQLTVYISSFFSGEFRAIFGLFLPYVPSVTYGAKFKYTRSIQRSNESSSEKHHAVNSNSLTTLDTRTKKTILLTVIYIRDHSSNFG